MADRTRGFRFGVYLTDVTSRAEFLDRCRRAEAYGYDTIGVADHLGMWGPFPAVMAAATATVRPRITTALLNAGFHNPTLLARDVATVDVLTGGRFDLGLGTGYERQEFETAGLAWPDPRRRVDHLAGTVARLREVFADPARLPRPVQRPGPPLWIGGRGDRLLALAAEHADIVGFTGFAATPDGRKGDLATVDGLAERVAHVRRHAGDRYPGLELNVLVWRVLVTPDRRGTAARLCPVRGLTASQLLDVPTVLVGTVAQIAAQLVEFRERLGISYFTVRDRNLDDFGPVIERLR